ELGVGALGLVRHERGADALLDAAQVVEGGVVERRRAQVGTGGGGGHGTSREMGLNGCDRHHCRVRPSIPRPEGPITPSGRKSPNVRCVDVSAMTRSLPAPATTRLWTPQRVLVTRSAQ